MLAYEARMLLHSTLSSARQSFTDVQVRESRTRGRRALREVQEDNDAAAEQEESKKKRTMKSKQPATAGKQQAAARNRSRARAYAGARSELFFLSQSLRKSSVVFARFKASKGYDEQGLTGEDGRH